MPLHPEEFYYAKTVANQVPYSIRYTPPTAIGETWQSGKNQTVVQCETPWETADQFIVDMIGKSAIAGGRLTRQLPEPCPRTNFQRCVDLRLAESYGNPRYPEPPSDPAFSSWPTLEKAVYVCTFESALYDVKEDEDVLWEWDRFTLVQYEYQGKNYRTSGGQFRIVPAGNPTTPPPPPPPPPNVPPPPWPPYGADQVPLPEMAVRAAGELTLNVRWLDIPKIEWEKLDRLAGRVNSHTMFAGLDGMPGFTAERVLFDSWKPEDRWSAAGLKTWDLTLKFVCKLGKDSSGNWNTWNVYPMARGLNRRITKDGANGKAGYVDGDPVYLVDDIREVFLFGDVSQLSTIP